MSSVPLPARSDAKNSVRSSAENRGVSSLVVSPSNGSLAGGAHSLVFDSRDHFARMPF